MSDDLLDTGLVAAAVTMAEEEAVPTAPAVPEVPPEATPVVAAPAVLPTNLPDKWTLPTVAALVTDLAANMYDLPYLLEKHGLSEAQYKTLQQNDFFKRALEAETLTWQGADSIQKRLALEAAIAMEAAMPALAVRMQKPTEDLASVTALVKVFAEIAGSIGGKNAQHVGPTEKFKIIINLGADVTEKEASPATVRVDAEGEVRQSAIQDLALGTRR